MDCYFVLGKIISLGLVKILDICFQAKATAIILDTYNDDIKNLFHKRKTNIIHMCFKCMWLIVHEKTEHVY